jgi:hypothetical protein
MQRKVGHSNDVVAATRHITSSPIAAPRFAFRSQPALFLTRGIHSHEARSLSLNSDSSDSRIAVSLRIDTVQSRRELARFIDLPWQIYNATDHPQWVPPLRMAVAEALDRKRNPFYQRADRELFVATRNGRIVGRIAAIENRSHNAFHEDRVGFFGFFESANDPEAAAALFAAAERWLRDRNLDTIRGPMSPSTNHECGMLVQGFRWPPMLMTTWNPRYYPALVEQSGLAKTKDLVAYFVPLTGKHAFKLPDRFARHAQRARDESEVTFRDLDLGNFKREIDVCWDVYNSAWEKNWGFVPMSREEFVFTAKEMKMLLLPQFAFIAEVKGEPAGFMLNIPDYNHAFKAIGNGRLFPTGIFKLLAAKRRIKVGRMMALGVKPQFRSRSIFALFAHELYRRAIEYDAVGGEASWILEDNAAMIQPMEALGAKVYRRWRIYEKELGARS